MTRQIDTKKLRNAIELLKGYKETCGDPGTPEVDETRGQCDECIEELSFIVAGEEL